jgi:gas vesicle protein GvpL/GvpF
MKCLLHCVFQYDGPAAPECGPGMAVIHRQGLAVATSPWRDGEPLDVARLLAYEKAIALWHATRTVVPLRFGCVREGPGQILQMLEEHEAEFRQLLGRLEGLAEMGLRVWWESPPEGPLPGAPGARYLAAARERQAGLLPLEEGWAHRIRGALEGCYVRQKSEARPAPEGRLVSLHFLVARVAAKDFRERVRRLALPGEMKFMVSGPWPPYNFVDQA